MAMIELWLWWIGVLGTCLVGVTASPPASIKVTGFNRPEVDGIYGTSGSGLSQTAIFARKTVQGEYVMLWWCKECEGLADGAWVFTAQTNVFQGTSSSGDRTYTA